MRSRMTGSLSWAIGGAAVMLLAFTACGVTPDPGDSEQIFPIEQHTLLFPEGRDETWRNSLGRTVQPKDEQPLEFNHGIHARTVDQGGLGMDCQFCHSNARKSKHAGVPTQQVCWNCHKMVPMERDTPEATEALATLKKYVDSGEPIPWIKVHDLPDFVHFNHSRHVQGGVECTECHADMTQETVAIRAPSMTMEMGWCLSCHEDHPSVEKNYGVQAELRRAELKDCNTCHQ